jgi:hypothetical protein
MDFAGSGDYLRVPIYSEIALDTDYTVAFYVSSSDVSLDTVWQNAPG